MKQLILSGGIDAVFCADDILAIGAIDACRDRRLSVPNDIGIIGFDDIAMASWSGYNLTTVKQPFAEITIAAVDHLLDLIENPVGQVSVKIYDCHAIVRGSLRSIAAIG